MDIGLREIVTIIALIIIAFVLIGGIRRYFRMRQSELRMDLDITSPLDGDPFDPHLDFDELPSDGVTARPSTRQSAFSDFRYGDLGSSHSGAKRERRGTDTVDYDYCDTSDSVAHASSKVASKKAVVTSEPQDVLVINVVTKPGKVIAGNDLMRTAIAAGMRFGEMDIFHAYETYGAVDSVVFSMANNKEPGSFPKGKMNSFSTTGLCLFMTLPGPKDLQESFARLLEMAFELSSRLGGELRDAKHQKLNQSTLESYQRMLDSYKKPVDLVTEAASVPAAVPESENTVELEVSPKNGEGEAGKSLESNELLVASSESKPEKALTPETVESFTTDIKSEAVEKPEKKLAIKEGTVDIDTLLIDRQSDSISKPTTSKSTVALESTSVSCDT